MSFVNLYLKTEYSMLQSSCKIEETIKRAVACGYSSIAMTDEGNMYGAIKFYQLAQKYQVKPILGLKLNYTYNDQVSSILLYAMNSFGYKNLMKLSSRYKIMNNKIELEYIIQNALGLLAIVPFSESVIFSYFNKNNYKLLTEHLNLLGTSFDQLYIGLKRQSHFERDTFEKAYQFFKQLNYKLVALNKVTYLDDDDVEVYRALKAIENGGELSELQDGEQNQSLYRPEEVEVQFTGYPDLIDNTEVIANRCQVKIKFGEYHLPKYDDDIKADEYLIELCLKGLRKRLLLNEIKNATPYYDRLKYELTTIKEMGFSDYFLIVWDFIKYAKTNNIYVGPGRGSAPASLVSYSLGITDVDPLHYDLLFERFLNKERISMPDIDTDFPDDTRDEVIKYVGRKYGANRVAHIVTFGTFKVKLALRDSARVYKLNDVRLKQVMKYINEYSGRELFTTTLTKIINTCEPLQNLMEEYEDINKVLTVASKIEGLPRNTSTHAAGIIITHHDLVNYTPLDNGLDDIYQTQYEASDLEALGLLKMDFLGLRNLTIINKTVELIKFDNPDFTIPKEMDDAMTFKMLASGDVSGVFQLESAGMRKVIMDLKVSKFEDIAHALALYRPGPMDIIPHFIDRKFGREKVVYVHPDLESILKETYGTIVYQDQIMQIARKFAGYSLGRADILRRAVSKKKLKDLEVEETYFVESSVKNGYTKETAGEIYEYIVKFANYGFNKAHSVAYARISYLTAYLKCHYFAYYLSTLMSSVQGSDSDILEYYQEALRKKIKVLPPMINDSKDYFMIKDQAILFPLSTIRGLGSIKTTQLLEERRNGKFTSFEDFVKRTSGILNGGLLENVIYSGALDEFGLTKKAMMDNYQTIIDRMSYDFVENYIEKVYDNEEFTYGELLDKEKSILGINLKYNFFYQYDYLYQKFNLVKISEVLEKQYNRVKTLGIVKQLKAIKTKAGESMAFVTLGDETANIDLTLFPTTYNKYLRIKPGQLVIVTGNTQKRKDLQIIVDEIEFL